MNCLLLLFSHSVVSDSLRPQGLQHARLPCPSLSPRACSNSCPSSGWCHSTISSSVAPFSSNELPPLNTMSQSRLTLHLNSHRTSDYKSVVHGPAVSTSPGNLLRMKMPEVNPDLLNQKLCRWGSSNLYFNKSFRHSLQFEKHCSINLVKDILINIWKISKIQRNSWSHRYFFFSS